MKGIPVQGNPHLAQTSNAINDSGAILLIISEQSILSKEVDSEPDSAHLRNKPIVPMLTGITWDNFVNQKQIWHRILGTVVAIEVSQATVPEALNHLQRGLETLGIFPKNSTDPHIAGECPYPLASLYATHLVGPVSLHQAFQVHASLQDVNSCNYPTACIPVRQLLPQGKFRQSQAGQGY